MEPQNRIAMEEQEIDWRHLFRTLLKYKYLIAAIAGAVFLVAVASLLILKPVYEAKGKLLYDSQNSNDILNPVLSLGTDSQNKINTQIETLKTYPIAEQVVADAHLTERGKPMDPAVFLKRITVKQAKGTNILEASYQDTNPELAAKVVNVYLSSAMAFNVNNKRERTSDTKAFLEEQLTNKQKDLAQSEEVIKDYKQREQVLDVSEDSKELIRRSAELDAEKAKTQLALKEVSARYERLRKVLGFPVGGSHNQDAQLDGLKKRLSALEANRAAQSDPPALDAEIVQVRQQITERKLALVKQDPPSGLSMKDSYAKNEQDNFYQENFKTLLAAEIEKEGLTERLKKLDQIIGDYDTRLAHVPTQELVLTRLLREREVNAKVYELLLTKLEETKIATTAIMGDLKIVEQARTPQKPVKPKKTKVLALGLLLGLLLGVSTALGYSYLRDLATDYEDLERILGRPVISKIPKLDFALNPLVTVSDPRSVGAEAFRTLRTQLRFMSPDRPLRSIVISSSMSGEGKSSISANLAIVMAQLGKKVVLVDGDLRQPSVHKLFQLSSNQGLSAYLAGSLSMEKLAQETKIENLSAITSGPVPPNALELLDSKKMEELLAQMNKEYDFVIIDAPPLIAVSDAIILSSKTDGMILAAASEETPRRLLKLARAHIERSNTQVHGVVFNKMDISDRRYYGYYYYGKDDLS